MLSISHNVIIFLRNGTCISCAVVLNFVLPGSKVKDYRSSGNEITVEYVGVPTAQHPGFRILVTVFKSR